MRLFLEVYGNDGLQERYLAVITLTSMKSSSVSKCLMSMGIIGAHLTQISYGLPTLFKRCTSSRNNLESEVLYK